MNTPAVHCHQIHRHFGNGDTRVHVLRGIDFTAASGQITFLAGPSGCGKTTLISVIAGLLQPSSGSVSLFGRDLASMPPDDAVRLRRKDIGFVFQQYHLIPALSVAENVAVPLLAASMKRRDALEQASAILDKLGLGDRLHQPPARLSGGQQQRVALARALVHQPRLVICDEPTAALDHETGHRVMELLAASAVHPDRAVLVVSHDNRIFHFADAIAHMDDGIITHIDHPNATAAV